MEIKFPLQQAVKKGDLENVRRVIEEGVSVNSQDEREWTPLHWAAEMGWYEGANLLIDRGCDINGLIYKKNDRAENRNAETTPLMSAAARGIKLFTPSTIYFDHHQEVAALLIQKGADVNHETETGLTALRFSIECWHHPQMLRVLLEAEKLDKNHQDILGYTPLHCVCCRSLDVFAFASPLLEAGADPNIKNIFGETALTKCIKKGHATLEVIRLFVQHGAFLEDKDCECILQHPLLKENVLKDVGLLTQSVLNKFHLQSLPKLFKNPYFARMLPNMDNFNLDARQIHEVENLVQREIERNTICDVLKA